MKKSFILFAASLLALAGCSRNQEINVPEANLSLFARTESPADTKTVVESGTHVYWEPGDEIAVFMGEKSAKFTTDITASSATATFKGTFGDTTWPEELDLWAVYPFSEDATFDGETITTTLPSEQIAREGSFGKDMNLAVAHSTSNTLQFYNVGGGIRFSVTEDGIKKVMFEGLSGEIISGKVRIGFENGLPIVKEVTGGRQFITLLPPSGKETFEKNTWYYIVAIPGALEGGYKLRFYKDSDYARNVSEKAVEIKRSIFGSIEKADSGIDYEATTTKFPETKEEWKQSIMATKDIIQTWDCIINSVSNIYDTEYLSREILLAEKVAAVEVVDSTIIVKQTDGIEICMLLEAYDSVYLQKSFTEAIESTKDNIIAHTKSNFYASSLRGKALILLPWYSAWFGTEPINAYKSSLKAIGFNENNITVRKDWEAGYTAFYGDQLSSYDVVIIHTHGCYLSTYGTSLVTGTKYNESFIDSYLSDRKSQGYVLCVPYVDNFGSFTTTAYVGMNSSFLNDASFHNSWIHLSGCETMKHLDLADAFLDKGAGLVTGFTKKVLGPTQAEPATKKLCDYLSQGISSTEALRQIDKKWLVEKVNENYTSYYLVDPHPKNLKNTEIRDSRTTLLWEQSKNAGEYKFQVHIKWPNSNSYSTYNATTSKAYTTDLLQPGEYSWYVEANLYYDGKVIETFTSETKHFTVTEELHYETPETIDLGLPSGTKWASFNLGATKPEGYGYYYAWGETEPKSTYSWSNYKWCKGTDHSLTKYCTDSSFGYNGFVDNKTKIELSDDAARFNLGSSFRTPTCDEWKELFENSSIEWTNSYYGTGVTGYILTSKVPGYTNNSVFLPSAGYFWGYQGHVGRYMTSESINCWPTGFDTMYFSSSDDDIYGCHYLSRSSTCAKDEGTTIRPVHPTQVKQITIVPTQTSGYVGNQIVLSTETVPLNASHNYIWSSSNESIAKVFSSRDNTCRINLVSPGVATITVTALDGNVSASCQVTVKERSSDPEISASPTSINYGDVKVGQGLGNETGRVTFTNTGRADLSISSIDCPDGFSHSPNLTFPIVISPGNYKTITFAFKPTEVKAYSGYLQIYSNASNGTCKVRVTGNGIE